MVDLVVFRSQKTTEYQVLLMIDRILIGTIACFTNIRQRPAPMAYKHCKTFIIHIKLWLVGSLFQTIEHIE